MYCGRTFICCPSVNSYFVSRDISAHSGGISVKLATKIYHVSGHCWKGFQGQRSKVKVMTRPVNL